MDSPEDETPLLGVETEMKELLGLYDVPAFARRGVELDHALVRLNDRIRRQRGPMLDMVQLRLRQWAVLANHPGSTVLDVEFEALTTLAGLVVPVVPATLGAARKPKAVARDLIASVERFNTRWSRFVEEINYDPINNMIDRYNRYYVLEKECTMGSARLAARYFEPRPLVSPASVLRDYPLLPVPRLIG